MCEKIREGKVLSPSSTDEDDILKETIVDNEINDEIEEEVVNPPKKKKRSKTKIKYCKMCHQDIIENENIDALRFTNGHHQLMAKDYCEDHKIVHSGHKCKPHWCGDCSFLINYEIKIDYDKS